jgi:hypothetical protein
MIRSVAYTKAVLAGMAGAITWEIVARLLIWAGVPFFDLVMTLGTLVLPHAPAWEAWLAGMAVHLLVGAIWAVFYAYFFWSVLPLRPALQGLVFAFVPMPLAIFIMHPQFDLMHPLVQSGEMSSFGLFGLGGGAHEPLSIAVGHLIWGSVVGRLYTRPVGYPVNRLPALSPRLGGSHLPVNSSPAPVEHRFMFAPASSAAIPPLRVGGGAWTRWRPVAITAIGAPTCNSCGISAYAICATALPFT